MPSLTREEKGFTSLDVYSTKELSTIYERLQINYDEGIDLSTVEGRNKVQPTLYFQKGMVEQGLESIVLPYWQNGAAVVMRPADAGSPFYKLSSNFYYARFRMVGGSAGTDISRRSLLKTLYAPLVLGIRYWWTYNPGKDEISGDRWVYETPQYLQLDSYNFHEDYLFNYQEWKETLEKQIAQDQLPRPDNDEEAKPPPGSKVDQFALYILQLKYKTEPPDQGEYLFRIPFVRFVQMQDSSMKYEIALQAVDDKKHSPFGFNKKKAPPIAIPKVKAVADAS